MKGFILFHDRRHPREMGAGEVQGYLSHLAVKQNVAVATQRQALNALLFLAVLTALTAKDAICVA